MTFLKFLGGFIVLFWLLGLILKIGGMIIHFLLLIAVVVFLIDIIF